MIIVRSKAPLRLGIAGGGTDVSPYSDDFGGCVLNATINLFAHATISSSSGDIVFEAYDLGETDVLPINGDFSIHQGLLLHRAIYLRIMNDFFDGKRMPIRISTYSDAPPGSGLGSSSTMVVAIIEGLRTFLNLPLGEYDVAKLAYQIEREDLGLAGGKQDQYAACFGGFNFMEFGANDLVVVNPLRIRPSIVNELEASLLLYYTGISRASAKIIEDQQLAVQNDNNSSLEALHFVKSSAYAIKERLLKSDIDGLIEEFRCAWLKKKETSTSISNPYIESIMTIAEDFGARAAKVSGAGGGGYMMIFVDPENRLPLVRKLNENGGMITNFNFFDRGATSWKT
jgi:D-glycero-alpha-D-manno-heptose-7-phosphate kinase